MTICQTSGETGYFQDLEDADSKFLKMSANQYNNR